MLTWPLVGARIAVGFALCAEAIVAAAPMSSIATGRYVHIPMVPGIPLPPDWLVVPLFVAMFASGMGLIIGWQHRWWAGACIGFATWLIASDQQLYSNHGYLMGLMALVLAFASGDAQPVRLALMGLLSAVYLFSGLSKLNPDFLSGGVLAAVTPLHRWGIPQQGMMLLAACVVVLELFLAVGFWWPPSRRIALVAGIALHVGIMVAMTDGRLELLAFALMMWSIYPLFFSRSPLRTSTAPREEGWSGLIDPAAPG